MHSVMVHECTHLQACPSTEVSVWPSVSKVSCQGVYMRSEPHSCYIIILSLYVDISVTGVWHKQFHLDYKAVQFP